MPMKLIPRRFALAPVLPDPANGSSTTPPTGHEYASKWSSRSSGFSVGWVARPCMDRTFKTDLLRRLQPSGDAKCSSSCGLSLQCDGGRLWRRVGRRSGAGTVGADLNTPDHLDPFNRQCVTSSWTRRKRSLWRPLPLCFSHTMSCTNSHSAISGAMQSRLRAEQNNHMEPLGLRTRAARRGHP